jgi:hypothetical protein
MTSRDPRLLRFIFGADHDRFAAIVLMSLRCRPEVVAHGSGEQERGHTK